MKIVSLNIWGGRAGKERLLSFIEKHANDVDVFCLQEVWSASYEHLGEYSAGGVVIKQSEIMVHSLQEISEILPDHAAYFHPHFMDNYGLCTFIKKDHVVTKEGEVFVHKHKEFKPEGDVGHHARNLQYVQTSHNGKPLTIINFHGLWNGKGKTDSEDRLEQSRKIVEFIKTLEGEIVFCGDFNLLPDTQSMEIIESSGLKNLIKEYSVTSTRTSFYTKPEKFADYTFVSKGIAIQTFKVLTDEVSDHAPLFLECSTL